MSRVGSPGAAGDALRRPEDPWWATSWRQREHRDHVRGLASCSETATSWNPSAEHRAASSTACSTHQPWLPWPVAPGVTMRSIASRRPGAAAPAAPRRGRRRGHPSGARWTRTRARWPNGPAAAAPRRCRRRSGSGAGPPGPAVVARATRSITVAGSTPTTDAAPAAARAAPRRPGRIRRRPRCRRHRGRRAAPRDRRPGAPDQEGAGRHQAAHPAKPGWSAWWFGMGGASRRCDGLMPSTLTIEPGFKSSGAVDDELLTIGEVARRAGVATSAVRYYERRGLLLPTPGARTAPLPRRIAAAPGLHRDAAGRRALPRRHHRRPRRR